jgi:ribokinase
MTRSPRIVVVGGLNMDLILQVPHLPRRGESVNGEQLLRAPGGKGANQAVAAARLGASVSMVGRVGRDAFGHELKSMLRDEEVSTRWVLGSERPTGAALIFVDDNGDNCIGIAPGANLDLLPDDVPERLLQEADVLVAGLEVPLATTAEALRLARQAGVRTVLNAAPAQSLPESLPRHADVLIVNEQEAAALTGSLDLASGTEAEAARAIRRDPDQIVVVTLGEDGALALVGDDVLRQPSYRVATVDSTGAGDAFVAAFAVARWWIDGVASALRLGCAAGALATTRPGAQPALPDLSSVLELLAAS